MLHAGVTRAGLGLLATAALLTLAACIAGASDTPEDTFQVGPAPVLIVENDNGEVHVAAREPGSIEVVTAIKYANNVDYSAEQSGDTITVRAKTINRLLSNPRVDMAITVPPETSVTITNGNGLVFVEGTRDSGKVTTGNGHVGLTDIQGDFHATTGNGKIAVTDGVGAFNLTSGNGDIVFKGSLNPGSTSTFNSGNGTVTVEFDGPPNVAIDAESESGRVRSDLEFSSTTRSEKDHLIGAIGGGAADLRIRTGRGDITIR